MRAKEREQLRNAVQLLMGDGDGDWDDGMAIVCRLAGVRTAMQIIPKDAGAVSIAELATMSDGEFQATREEADHGE